MSARSHWRAEVARHVFPVGMRPIKATLLSLPVDIDGVLHAWRDQISEATGLPLRTIDRHLARAVEAGWLTHAAHGGHGRRARYEVTTPEEVARQKRQTTNPSCAPRSTRNSDGVARHMVAKSEEIESEHREHVAVEVRRRRKSAQRDACGLRLAAVTELRSDERAADDSSVVAQFRTQRRTQRKAAS